jgi:hypothetical protein
MTARGQADRCAHCFALCIRSITFCCLSCIAVAVEVVLVDAILCVAMGVVARSGITSSKFLLAFDLLPRCTARVVLVFLAMCRFLSSIGALGNYAPPR